MDKVSVSERLREAMNIRNMKQIELVEATGIGKSSLSQYLSGKYSPKTDKILLLAKALNVSDVWLMGWDVQMDREDWTISPVEEFEDFIKKASENYNNANGIEDIKEVYQLILNNKGKIYLIEQLILLLNAPVFLEDYNFNDKFDVDSAKLHINKLIKIKEELAKEGGEQ